MSKRNLQIGMIIGGTIIGMLILIGWVATERLDRSIGTVGQQGTPGVDTNVQKEQKKIFNNFTPEDVSEHIEQITPTLADKYNDPRGGFELLEVKIPLDNWAVVLLRPYENPDGVIIVTVLRDNGKALVTKLKPVPLCQVEHYLNNSELPKEVTDILIECDNEDNLL